MRCCSRRSARFPICSAMPARSTGSRRLLLGAEFVRRAVRALAARRRRRQSRGQEPLRLFDRLSLRALRRAARRSRRGWTGSVADQNEPRRSLTPEQARRRRRRSVAIAVLLAVLVVLFYVMALMHGPSLHGSPAMSLRGHDQPPTATALVAGVARRRRRRHGRADLRRGAALQPLLPGDRLWRHDAARRRPAPTARSTARSWCASMRTCRAFPGLFGRRSRRSALKLGETALVNFIAENTGKSATDGTATFNVQPEIGGALLQQDRVLLLHRAAPAAGRAHRDGRCSSSSRRTWRTTAS